MNILVLGIGQSFRGDDAAGLEATRMWQEMHPHMAGRVRVEISELPGLGLLAYLTDVDAAILVDAVQADSPAGTVIRVGPEELASFTPDAQSAHGWGVAETLQLGRSLYPNLLQIRMTLIGIVGQDFAMGAGLSSPVREALGEAVKRIEAEVQELLVIQ
jgi:hydrogenase maturation protease